MTKVKTYRLDDKQEKFIKRALDWYEIMQKLVAFGSIKEIPDPFVLPQATIVSEQHTSQPTTCNELPPFVEDILNGGAYPNKEDCTHEEAAILYNEAFQSLFKAYVSARDDKVRLSVKQQIAETVKSICLTLR